MVDIQYQHYADIKHRPRGECDFIQVVVTKRSSARPSNPLLQNPRKRYDSKY